MPCIDCHKLQTDPVKGASPWARLVVKGEQILLCPDCQLKDPSWTDRGDRCGSCGGTRLSVVMGTIICRSCGSEVDRDRE